MISRSIDLYDFKHKTIIRAICNKIEEEDTNSDSSILQGYCDTSNVIEITSDICFHLLKKNKLILLPEYVNLIFDYDSDIKYKDYDRNKINQMLLHVQLVSRSFLFQRCRHLKISYITGEPSISTYNLNAIFEDSRYLSYFLRLPIIESATIGFMSVLSDYEDNPDARVQKLTHVMEVLDELYKRNSIKFLRLTPEFLSINHSYWVTNPNILKKLVADENDKYDRDPKIEIIYL